MPLMNYLKTKIVATLETNKEYDGVHKHKDSAPWIYHYTIIHKRYRENRFLKVEKYLF